MASLRCRLALLAALWLVGQTAALAVAPLTMALAGSAPVAQCECPGGMAAQACPMHRSPNREASPESDRAMRSACAPDDAVLLSLGLGLGVLPAPVGVTSALPDRDVPAPRFASLDRAFPPDPFPPRA